MFYHLFLISLLYFSYREVEAACGTTEIKQCVAPAAKYATENGLDISSKTLNDDCKKVSEAKKCLTDHGCQRPAETATDDVSVSSTLVFDVAEDFCSDANKKLIIEHQRCLTAANIDKAIDKCDDHMPEGVPACPDLREDLQCRFDAFATCNKGAAAAITSFTTKYFMRQVRPKNVICEQNDLKPLPNCTKDDYSPCNAQFKTLQEASHKPATPEESPLDLSLDAATVERQCKAFADIKECAKKLPCRPVLDMTKEPSATAAVLFTIYKNQCTEKNRQLFLASNFATIHKCLTSESVTNGTRKCEQKWAPQPTPKPADQCQRLNSRLRCEYYEFMDCTPIFDSSLDRLFLFNAYKLIEKQLQVHGEPHCDLESDLQSIVNAVSRPALSYSFLLIALVTSLIFRGSN